MQTNKITLLARSVFAGYKKNFMNELTKKVQEMPVEMMRALLMKYSPLLDVINEHNQHQYLVYVFETAMGYIEKKHAALSIDRKSWVFVCLKYFQLKGLLKKDQDIFDCIDDFFDFYEKNHPAYLNDIAIYSSEYDRDCVFLDIYLRKKSAV
jgi:hypothetical protein